MRVNLCTVPWDSVCYSGEVVVSRDSTGSLMIRFYTAWQKFYSELTIPMEFPKYFSKYLIILITGFYWPILELFAMCTVSKPNYWILNKYTTSQCHSIAKRC